MFAFSSFNKSKAKANNFLSAYDKRKSSPDLEMIKFNSWKNCSFGSLIIIFPSSIDWSNNILDFKSLTSSVISDTVKLNLPFGSKPFINAEASKT